MPKTTKEITKNENEKSVSKSKVYTSKKAPASKVASTTKATSSSKTAAKKTTAKSTKSSKTTAKETTVKSTKSSKTTAKETTAKSTKSSKITAKETTAKSTKSSKTTAKETAKKSTSKPKSSASKVAKKSVSSKKTVSKKSTSKKSVSKKIDILEYYDLPYRYNKTIVKVLAQTPKTLFVYWDVSDNDRLSYIKQYGENFFENTKPVLIIHNTTMNYSFEIEINDFANCWYFNVNDEKCEYLVELGRRPKTDNVSIPNNYLHITSSNKIESPNGHILFEKEQKTLFYRNVKTNETYSKDAANLQFIKHFGRIYNIYEMYKKIYKEENLSNLNNPSSH